MLDRRAGAPEIGEVAALTGAEARGLFPPLRGDRAAVWVGGACRVDGRLLAGALARAGADRGAVFRAAPAQLVCRAGRAVGVRLDGELIEADAVVAATGAWTGSFLEPAGVTVAVTPQRGQIVHLSAEPADTSRWPVVLPGGSGHYLLAFDGSRVVAGRHPRGRRRVRPPGDGGGLAEVLGQALAVAPGLAAASYLKTRVGFRPSSPDARPLLGPVPGVDGLVVATGLGPTGLTMGPYAGAVAARVAISEPPGVDLTPFDPLRASPVTFRCAAGLSAAAVEVPGDHPGGHGVRRGVVLRDAHVHVARGDLAGHGVGGAARQPERGLRQPEGHADLPGRRVERGAPCAEVIVASSDGQRRPVAP